MFKFDGKKFPCDFTPLSPEAEATLDRVTVYRFNVKQMLTVRPLPIEPFPRPPHPSGRLTPR